MSQFDALTDSSDDDQLLLAFLDHSDDEQMAQIVIQTASDFSFDLEAPCKGGSAPGRAPNLFRDWKTRDVRLFEQYFSKDPIYPESLFRRRFRMSRRLFLRIHDAVVAHDTYFEQRPDCTGKIGISSRLKITAALRILAYGCSADSLDENLEMSETTVLKCTEHFVKSVIAIFGEEYQRQPSRDDLKRILQVAEKRGMPGMLGSIDCMHWAWKNCPSSLAGQHKGKEAKPTVVLEAIADHDLWIWHANFGSPGSLNDINILNASSLLKTLLDENAMQLEFIINNRTHRKGYFLADGIYPEMSIFVKSLSAPINPKQKLFVQEQEALRKDVERCFGVLQARFRIVDLPCRLWHKNAMMNVMQACIILHNMIIEDELDSGEDDIFRHLFQKENQPNGDIPKFKISRPDERHLFAPTIEHLLGAFDVLQSKRLHQQLRTDIIEHLWSKKGDSVSF